MHMNSTNMTSCARFCKKALATTLKVALLPLPTAQRGSFCVVCSRRGGWASTASDITTAPKYTCKDKLTRTLGYSEERKKDTPLDLRRSTIEWPRTSLMGVSYWGVVELQEYLTCS
jgi:hypothetical protein